MVKLIALYSKPDDAAAFNTHYRETHMPLAMKMPGLRKCELGVIKSAAGGGEARYFLQAELYFDNQAALDAAMKSAEGRAAAKDVMGFAGKLIHMMVAEVETSTPG